MPEPVNRQEDFGAGIYRGREAPANAVYDAVNCLIDDEGQLFRRGGCGAYVSAVGTEPVSLAVADLIPGRVALWSHTGGTGVMRASVNGGAPFTLTGDGAHPVIDARRPVYGDMVVYLHALAGQNWVRLWGGAQMADYSAGTVTVTQYSETVTGVGTTWTGNVVPGGILRVGNTLGVVRTVDSNTQVTLTTPWPAQTAAASGYTIKDREIPSGVVTLHSGNVATAGRRLLVALGRRMYFSVIDNPGLIPDDHYHEFPSNILEVEGFGDSAIVFTDRGTYAVRNLLYDPVDDAGNQQHTVDLLNSLRLWDGHGVTQWEGAIIVPARDDVYVMGPDGVAAPITGSDQNEKIRPLWRSYVRAGYSLGVSAVYDGTLLLPVMDGSQDVVTVLACRLDRGATWTRWSGEAAGRAFAVVKSDLYIAADTAIRTGVGCFTPSAGNASDADGSTHAIDVIGRDFRTPGPGKGATTTRLRVRYDGVAAATPAVTASFARGLEGASFTALTAVKGGAASDGLDHSVWRVNKQAPAIRFRLQSSSAFSSFTLRAIEAPFTRHGLA